MRRNVAIAMGNSGTAAFEPQLEEWSLEEDAVLAETARWALEQLKRESQVPLAPSSKPKAGSGPEQQPTAAAPLLLA